MAERRRTKKAAEPAPPAAAGSTQAEPAEAEPAEPAEAEPSGQEEPAGQEEPVFANRAERRAHARGKGAQQPKATGKIEAHGRRGPAQSPRSWANRRSG
jgi:hypothetical protein